MARKSKIVMYGLANIFLETYNGTNNNSTRTAEILSKHVNVQQAEDVIYRQNVDDYLKILQRTSKKEIQKTKPIPAETKEAAELLVKDRNHIFDTWNKLYNHAFKNMKIILEDIDPNDENLKAKLPVQKRKPPEEKLGLIETMVNKIMKRSFDFHKIGVSEKGDVNVMIVQYEEQVDMISQVVREQCCEKCKRSISSEIRSIQSIATQHQ